MVLSRGNRFFAAYSTALSTFILLCFSLFCFSCSESPDEVFERLNTEAERYFADKQYGQAISTWNKLLSLHPEASDISPKLAESYRRRGLYPQALETLQKHLVQEPDSMETRLSIMKMQVQLLDLDGARTSWACLRDFPQNPSGLTAYGDLLAAENHYIMAIEQYQQALSLAPHNQPTLARLAVILLGQQQNRQAEIFYHTLEAQHPESSEILLQMGNYWLLQGDEEKGELFLQKAIEHVPEDLNLKIKLAELYLDSGNFAKSTALFKQLLENTPQNRFFKKMLVECLLLSKQFTEADEVLVELTAAENQDIDFLLLKGKFYLNTGKYLLAASQLESALEKEPEHPLAYYFLALSYIASGQNNLGQSYLTKCLALNPNFTAAELILADCFYKTGNYELALQHVAQIQNREPENPRAVLLKGSILLALKKYDDAIEELHKANILNPDSPAPQFFLSVLFTLTGKPEQALALLKSMLAKQPFLTDATLLYAQTLCAQGQQDQALAYLEDSIATHPDWPYIHHIYGLILLSTGKQQEAVKAFETAIKLAPDMKESYLQLFKGYRNDSEKLEKILLQAIGKINNFEEAMTTLASHYVEKNRAEKATVLLEDALARTPSSPLLANNLACLYLDHQPDKINEAMRLATLAYDKESNNAAIADTLGWAYYKKDNLVRAGWLLKEAAALKPDNPKILYHLGIVQQAMDKKP